ncbi:MAG: DinB family protein [Bacteroidetes bacterium]|nr:MAG: DinB family protein [Bacteroidota bacterium]
MNTPTNRRTFLRSASLGTAGILAAAPATLAAIPKVKSESGEYFVPQWERCKEITLAYANAMPEETYHFKPTEEVRSFADQMLHIAGSSVFFSSSFLGGTGAPDRDYTPDGKSKDEVIELMTEAFDYATSVLSEMTDEQLHEDAETFAGTFPKNEVILMMRDHVTHHRGQTVVYLRLKGITPPDPSWVGW